MTQIFYNRLPRGLHLIQNEDKSASIVGIPDDIPGYYRCEDSITGTLTEHGVFNFILSANNENLDFDLDVIW